MSDKNDRDSLENLEKKLIHFIDRIDKKKKIKENNNELSQAMTLGVKIASEMIASIVFGLLIGYLLDLFFHTMPWLLIFFVILGTILGIVNAYKATTRYTQKNNYL